MKDEGIVVYDYLQYLRKSANLNMADHVHYTRDTSWRLGGGMAYMFVANPFSPSPQDVFVSADNIL